MCDYNKRVEKLKELIDDADYIIIGAGAGFSEAAAIGRRSGTHVCFRAVGE